MFPDLTLDYVQHLESGYCVNHPNVIAHTQQQVVDRAVKQLLEALQALNFDITGTTIRIGERYLRDNLILLQYSNDGATWHDIGAIPDVISSPVTLGTLQLRDNAGAFELSTDSGQTWASVGATVMTSALATHLTDDPLLHNPVSGGLIIHPPSVGPHAIVTGGAKNIVSYPGQQFTLGNPIAPGDSFWIVAGITNAAATSVSSSVYPFVAKTLQGYTVTAATTRCNCIYFVYVSVPTYIAPCWLMTVMVGTWTPS